MEYTPRIIEFLIRHWNVDVKGPRLAQLLGMDYNSLKQAVARLRINGHPFVSNRKPIGHIQETRRKGCARTIRRIKTESGFKYIPLTKSERQRAERQSKEAGKRGRPPMPVGTITEVHRRGVVERYIKTESGKVYLPLENPKKGGRKKQAVKPRKEVKAAPRKPEQVKRAVSAPQVAKPTTLHHTNHTRSKNPVINTANPSKVKIRQEEGGKWVYCPVKRGHVYRKMEAA